MTMQKTIGILSALMLVAMLIITPLSDHAFASNSKKTSKGTSDVTKTNSKSKNTIEQKNLKTEARHKKAKN